MNYHDMYFSTSHHRKPKHKVACSVVTMDGVALEGSLFATGDERIKDLLNGENAFVPLETFDGEIHLLIRVALHGDQFRSQNVCIRIVRVERARVVEHGLGLGLVETLLLHQYLGLDPIGERRRPFQGLFQQVW